MAQDFAILYEDNHVIVVSKPSRLLTASDKTGDESLIEKVRVYNASRQLHGNKGYLAPLHFLDRPVSGAVMFAKSSKAASRLSEQLRTRKVFKRYHAIVEGEPSADGGELIDFLLKDRDENFTRVAKEGQPNAKRSVLSYRVTERRGALARVEVTLGTGRSHQIRVQLSSRGMPIFGDTKYGARSGWEGAIALHAAVVTFTHPVTKDPVTVAAPEPLAWQDLWPSSPSKC